MTAPAEVKALIQRFTSGFHSYKRSTYNETQTRVEFVNPLLKALGWDVSNERGAIESAKDVIHEAHVEVEGRLKAPDYALRVNGTQRFYVETKKPSVDISTATDPCFQLRTYSWSAGNSIGILTNFEHFSIYDSRVKPELSDHPAKARLLHFHFDEFEDRWSEISALLSRKSVYGGSIEKILPDAKRKKGYSEVDAAFLSDIEKWRLDLATDISYRNPGLDDFKLTEAVQRTIDRIIFLRLAEDRNFEKFGQLRDALNGKNIYRQLGKLFTSADARYNSGLFHFRKGDGHQDTLDTYSLQLDVGDSALTKIIRAMYYPKSTYIFSVIPLDILGKVYEQFLGKIIKTDSGKVRVEEKPEVRKAGGVFYTPGFIASYIVSSTLGDILKARSLEFVAGTTGKSPAGPVRVIDPACGSGRFLVEAYQIIMRWHLDKYTTAPEKHSRGRNPRIVRWAGAWKLSVSERRRILIDHIFGVDVDVQAVEVTKLSLLLCLLEGESGDSFAAQSDLFRSRVLPDLGKNIVCGNSLVDRDFYKKAGRKLTRDELRRTNAFSWQSFIQDATNGHGFDVVVGNPPYVQLEDDNRNDLLISYFREHYSSAAYKLDMYVLFIERGYSLLSDRGTLSFIVPSNFLTNNNLSKLRSMLVDGKCLREVVSHKGSVFDQATVNTCTFILDRQSRGTQRFRTAIASVEDKSLRLLNDSTVAFNSIIKDPKRLISFADDKARSVLKAVERLSQHLGDIANVNFGKQLRDRKIHDDDVLTTSSIETVPDGYDACYTGRDVSRWAVTWSGLACLSDPDARRGGCWDVEKHQRVGKLLTRQIGRHPVFGVDNDGYHCLNTIFMVTPFDGYDTYAIAAILNSEIIKFYWEKKFLDDRGAFPKIKGSYLKLLPVPQDRFFRSKKAADLSELAMDAESVTSSLSSETDQLVIAQLRMQLQGVEEQINTIVQEAFGVSPGEVMM